MNRTERGYVFMKGKKYFVYEGLNLIGRQKGVTIVIPDINISHQHSVIVIIDNHHYLSDTNSSNGTYLKDLKLCPMKLYQLNNGDAIKFGLIDATYFKLENDAVSELEHVENAHTQIDDNIFNVATQFYDIPAPNNKGHTYNKLVGDNYSFKTPARKLETESINDLPTQIIVNENVEITSSKLETISINDLPTQIMFNKNDSDTEDEASFNNIDKQEDTLVSNILINDLPTQLVTPEKDDDSSFACDVGNGNTDQEITKTDIIDDTIVSDDNEKEGIVGDQQRHDENSKESVDLVTMQPVSESHSQLLVQELRRRVRNVISSSEDESSGADSQRRRNENGDANDHHDENSNESVDLITMRPAATQNFSSESPSQLYVQELQRRIRYVIDSSDDEHSESDSRSRKRDAKRKSPRSSAKMDASSSEDDDDETDVEASSLSDKKKRRSLMKRNKPLVDTDSDGESSATDADVEASSLSDKKKRSLMKRNKPVVDTDSDGESSATDAEEELKKISGDFVTAQGSAKFCPDKKSEESEGGTRSADYKIDIMLDDSDVIPTTQPGGDPNKNTNFESSVPLDSSFDLILTHSPPSPLAAETAAGHVDEAEEEQMTSKNDKSDDLESQRTQLEVSFDEDNITGPFELVGDTLRPLNPLVNVFEAVASSPNSPSPKKDDSIEDRLSKMFQSQIAEKGGPPDDDDLFLIPTQLGIKKAGEEKDSKKGDAQSEDDIFLQPTQFISNEEKNKADVIVDAVQNDKNKYDVFLQPTQKITNVVSDVGNDSKSSTDKSDMKPIARSFGDVEKEDDKNEDLFLRPTQIITNVVDKAGNNNKSAISEITTDKLDQKSNLKKVDDSALEYDENEDLFLQPTQMIPTVVGKAGNDNRSTPKITRDKLDQTSKLKDDENEDLFSQPTQMITNIVDKEVNENKFTISKVSVGKLDQESKLKKADDLAQEGDESEDLFLQPTQVITNVADKAGNDNKSAISKISMGKLDQKSKLKKVDDLALDDDENEDLFLQPTQMITTVVGTKAGNYNRSTTPKITTDKLDQTSKLKDDENEDLYLQPTQIITNVVEKAGSDNKSTTPMISTKKLDQKSKLKKADDLAQEDDENEDPFLQPTQMITNVTSGTKDDSKSTITKMTIDRLGEKSKLKKSDELAQEVDENEDLFLQPTQMITNVVEQAGNDNKSTISKIAMGKLDVKSKLKKVDDLAQEDAENEDPFLQPTQMINKVTSETRNDSKSTIRKTTTDELDQKSKLRKVDNAAQLVDENEDLFLQPTQMITNVVDKAGNDNKSTTSKIATDKLDVKSKLKKVDELAQEDDENEDPFLQPTQMITKVTSETRNDSKSTIRKTTTDELDQKSKLRKVDDAAQLVDENEDLFLQPTQMISNVVSEVITDIKSTVCKNTTDGSAKKSVAKSIDEVVKEDHESEDLFLQPTQMIANVVEGTNNDSKSPICKTAADKSSKESIAKNLDDLARGNDENENKNAVDTLQCVADVVLAASPSRTRGTSSKEVQKTPVKRRQVRSAVESVSKRRKTRNNINTNDEETQPKEELKFIARRSKRKQSSDGGVMSNASPVDIVRPLDEAIYVIKEISDAAGEFDKAEANSADEFEQPEKEKARPSPPHPKTPVKRSRATAPKRQTRQKKSEAQTKESNVHTADVVGAESLPLDETPPPMKVRKVQETTESSTPSVRQRSNRRNTKKVIADEFEELVGPATPTTSSRGAIATTRTQKDQTERAENVEELSAFVNADKKNETSRKSARNTKRTKTKIDDEELPSSDAGSKADTTTIVGETKTKRQSRATKGVKVAEQNCTGDEDESKCRSTVDVGEVRSRRGRVSSAASEEDVNKIKNEKKVSTTPSSLLTPGTPERTKRKLKPKVVFTMLDSPELETIIRSLGGFVVDSADACTVLLTSSVKRSLKLLSAIGQGKPICSPKWLHESKKAHAFLDPWNYILEDEEAEKKWNFSLKESLKRSAERKLLVNCTFQIMVNTAQDVLKGSIESCGGKCVSRAPSKDNRANFFVVASTETRNKYVKFLKEKPAPKIVAAEAIFDGVLRQELHFEDHLLA